MIAEVDQALGELVREIPGVPKDVDVVFDAPTKDWAARRNAPTVNLYLYDIREDVRRRERGFVETRDDRGIIVTRAPGPRFFKLSYLVTAWTQRPEDEHRLLDGLLRSLLPYDALPAGADDRQPRGGRATRVGHRRAASAGRSRLRRRVVLARRRTEAVAGCGRDGADEHRRRLRGRPAGHRRRARRVRRHGRAAVPPSSAHEIHARADRSDGGRPEHHPPAGPTRRHRGSHPRAGHGCGAPTIRTPTIRSVACISARRWSIACSMAARGVARWSDASGRLEACERAADEAVAAGHSAAAARPARDVRTRRGRHRHARHRARRRPRSAVRAVLRLSQRRRQPSAPVRRAGPRAVRRCRSSRREDRGRFLHGPLVASGLVGIDDLDRPLPSSALRVPDRVVSHLLGDDTLDRALDGDRDGCSADRVGGYLVRDRRGP